MNNIKNYGPFQLWVLNNFPFTIDDWDSITQYQMLCKCLGALKEQLDVNSDLYKKITDLENYLENLDLQEEVNHKIDEMVEDGTLDEIINQEVFSELNQKITNVKIEADSNADDIENLTSSVNGFNDSLNENVSSLNNEITNLRTVVNSNYNEHESEIDTLSSRIDNIASLPEGSTTADAELIDIRTAYNGVVYASAGEAVRAQCSNLNDVDNSIIYNGSKERRFYNLTPNTANTIDWTNLNIKNMEYFKILITSSNMTNGSPIYVYLNYTNGGYKLVNVAHIGSECYCVAKGGEATGIRLVTEASDTVSGSILVKFSYVYNGLIDLNTKYQYKDIDKLLFNINYISSYNTKQNRDFVQYYYTFIPKGTKFKINWTGTNLSNAPYMSIRYCDSTFTNKDLKTLLNNTDFIYTAQEDIYGFYMFLNAVDVVGNSLITLSITSDDNLNNKINHNLGNVGIIGDSYSTFENWLPNNYISWYKEQGNLSDNNVNDVRYTWWHLLLNKCKGNLLLNSSYSGATICNTGYTPEASSYSFVNRIATDFGSTKTLNVKPDTIFIMGGLNDTVNESPVGSVKYSNWTTADLNNVLPAFCYMIDYLKKYNPGVRIINLVVDGVSTAIKNGMKTACDYYGIENIIVSQYTTVNAHPDRNGMESICNQILSKI